MHQLLTANPLTHNQRFIRFTNPQPSHKANRRIALSDQTERGEGREEEGVRRGVDEVAECDEGGGEADGGAVERGDEDFRVCVEGVRYVEVVGDEVF
jgi:hypothetical protein